MGIYLPEVMVRDAAKGMARVAKRYKTTNTPFTAGPS
jgi:hypothetical protein